MASQVQLKLSFMLFIIASSLSSHSCLQRAEAAATHSPSLKPSATSASQPKSVEFYMYIAVQNNSVASGIGAYTAVQSAQPTQSQPFAFGTIHTFDNRLYAAASLDAKQLGRVQGWYGNAGQEILTLFLVQTFSLSGSPGGTFSLMGIDVATDNVKYGAIVGGTGDFAYARGVATQSLVSTQIVNQQTVSWFHYAIELKYW